MTGPDFTIERVTLTPTGKLVYQVVTSSWERRSVTMPRKLATGDTIDATITRALANVDRPVKPL